MATGRSLSHVWWCCALACASLALVTVDALLVDITYVESAVAKGAGERAQLPLFFTNSVLLISSG
jgi:hypothetical protein